MGIFRVEDLGFRVTIIIGIHIYIYIHSTAAGQAS